nr:urease accessory protein UreF [Mesorhizobium sp. J18]
MDMAAMTMTEGTLPALLRLMTWLSPAFPVGSFSYSHGLERAILEGLVRDRDTLVAWLRALIEHGSAWNDSVLLAQAWRETAAARSCMEAAELAEAMAGSRERQMETMLQGEAFVAGISAWSDKSRPQETGMAYPVAVGQAAASHAIDLHEVLAAYLHAFASNLVQAAIRLVPLGQRDGVKAVASLEVTIRETAARACRSTLDDLGSSTFLSDVMAMRHEVQYSRVFRS